MLGRLPGGGSQHGLFRCKRVREVPREPAALGVCVWRHLGRGSRHIWGGGSRSKLPDWFHQTESEINKEGETLRKTIFLEEMIIHFKIVLIMKTYNSIYLYLLRLVLWPRYGPSGWMFRVTLKRMCPAVFVECSINVCQTKLGDYCSNLLCTSWFSLYSF